MRSVDISKLAAGRLFLSGMPGRCEPLGQFLAEARAENVSVVVRLTPMDEVREKSPAYHAALEGDSLPFRVLAVEIPNFGVPEDEAAFRVGIRAAAADLRSGANVAIHCAAGIGRTGTAAACLLKELGLPVAQALEAVREAGSDPEGHAQRSLIREY